MILQMEKNQMIYDMKIELAVVKATNKNTNKILFILNNWSGISINTQFFWMKVEFLNSFLFHNRFYTFSFYFVSLLYRSFYDYGLFKRCCGFSNIMVILAKIFKEVNE